MITINLENIDKITFDENLFDVSLEGRNLRIYSKIKGDVIDANFTELDTRLSNVESNLRLRINGELLRLRTEIDELKNKPQQNKVEKEK